MQNGVRNKAKRNAIRNGIGKAHHSNAGKAGNRFRDIIPRNTGNLLHHQKAHDNECRRRRKSWNRQEKRGQEERDQEKHPGYYASKSGTSAFRNSGRGLNKRRNGRCAKHSANGRSDGICQQNAFDSRQFSVLVQHIRF